MVDGAAEFAIADAARLKTELVDIERLSQSFGNTLTRAFASAIIDGRKLSDVLRGIALSLSQQALSAALKPLGNLIGGLFANADGNVFSVGRVTGFAAGGVVNGPTMFAMQGGLGLMGEAGPEAVMPLARGADGKLGVRAGGGAPVQVTVNISTPDVAGFQRSQSQVTAAVARAVERGTRNL